MSHTPATRSLDFSTARRLLLDKRHELLSRHQQTIADEAELLNSSEPDVPDLAANRSAAALLDRLGDAELLALTRIASALDRLDDGSYGRCTVCGEPIAHDRLAVMPEADRCGRCTNSH